MKNLDFSGRQQLYYQLYDILFQKIISGEYKEGSLLPSERELIETYEVSRATVRKAMEMLDNERLIEKRRGYGTVVINSKPKNYLSRVVNYTQKSKENQAITYKKVIAQRVIKADHKIASGLALEEGDQIIEIKRLRYSDAEPMYLETSYFEKVWVPEVLNHDFSKESLRIFLMNNYHSDWKNERQKIYSVLADEEKAKLLSIKVGDPLIFMIKLICDAGNTPREYIEIYYRADKYYLDLELTV